MFPKNFWTKFTNKDKYQDLKNKEKIENSALLFNKKYKSVIEEIQKKIIGQKNLNFLHSGHAADIVNVLPVIKELSKNHICNLYINVNKPLKFYYKHPAGDFFLNKKIFDMLKPLIKKQDYISKCEIYNNEKIDINFDLIRELPINILFDNTRYASIVTGVQPDLSLEFLTAESHNEYEDYIAIQRTFRYRNQFIDYEFLNNYKKLLFVGVKSEYDDLKSVIKNLEFYNCKDFYDMARVIKSSKFTIGNSSLAFPIAEGLKVPRLLEACPYFPAAQPHGKNGYDFYFQTQFENLVKQLNNN
tara:strand:- start:737 stop:1639 length:903 start_codon:yes stop_codon:yes gene_type:complete